MTHIHVWTWGPPVYDFQSCNECGAIRPDETEEKFDETD